MHQMTFSTLNVEKYSKRAPQLMRRGPRFYPRRREAAKPTPAPPSIARSSLILLAVIFFNCYPFPVFAETVKLKAGTFVPAVLAQTLSSEESHTGDTVNYTVGSDVVVDGKTVISAGTLIQATVSYAEEARMIGQPGKMSISFVSTTAVDDQKILLLGSKTYVGEDETTGTVVVGVVLCPLALMNSGDEASVGEGTQGRAIVATNANVEVSN